MTPVFLLVMLCGQPAAASDLVELHRIRIENENGGAIEVSPDGGANWLEIGSVLRPARRLVEGYAATRWSQDGTVCCSAVHGLRIRVRRCSEDGRGALFALTPKEFASPPPGFGGFDPGAAGIYTDIRAGTGVFRSLAPFVGNRAYIEYSDHLEPLPRTYEPTVGDTIVLIVERPRRHPSALVFETRPGGAVTMEFADGTVERIATVERPVRGVGRFDATGYTGVGCINTNHAGVITISTAPDHNGEPLFDDPFGETRGGFMIQPNRHAENEGKPIEQVMVVGPVRAGAPALEGQPPLFAGYLGLSFQSRDPAAGYTCLMSVDGGPWEPLPEYVGRHESLFEAPALTRYFRDRGAPRVVRQGVTALRIAFPEQRETETEETAMSTENSAPAPWHAFEASESDLAI